MTKIKRQILNRLITIREVWKASKKSKAKASIPDDILASYYKCFED